jgi:nucleosome-remodeling factor subunit BPTF
MSTRSSTRKKVAPSRISAQQDTDTPRSRKAKQPKLSTADDGGDGLSSRGSSPGSRPVTPATSRSRRSGGQKAAGRPKKRGRASGANTPASRQSRASSVSSTAKAAAAIAKKGGGRKSKAIKTKASTTSFNKETDYHYGSDFEGNMYDDNDNDSDNSSDSDLSDMDSFSDDMKPESDVELEPNLIEDEDLPDWLEDPASIPKLVLPESSDDLLLLPDQAFEAITVYEVLRQYQKILRLSPFRFEDFCAMLASPDQSNLTSEIHISLLKALLREDDNQQAQYGPLDQKDSMNVFVNFIDSVTWPENLRFYLSTEPDLYKEALDVVTSCEYPFTDVENRIKVLRILTDALLSWCRIGRS